MIIIQKLQNIQRRELTTFKSASGCPPSVNKASPFNFSWPTGIIETISCYSVIKGADVNKWNKVLLVIEYDLTLPPNVPSSRSVWRRISSPVYTINPLNNTPRSLSRTARKVNNAKSNVFVARKSPH